MLAFRYSVHVTIMNCENTTEERGENEDMLQ